jgi:hypothetical protein
MVPCLPCPVLSVVYACFLASVLQAAKRVWERGQECFEMHASRRCLWLACGCL